MQEDLIRREGYPVETHIVTTADGYMPMLVRIPHGRRAASRSAPDAAEAEESSDDSPRSRRGRRWAAASPSRPVWPSLGPNFSQALGPGLGARVVAEEAAGDAGRARRQQQDQHTAGRPAAPKGPVLIVHGVLQSSDNWVLRGKDHDLRECSTRLTWVGESEILPQKLGTFSEISIYFTIYFHFIRKL